VIRVAGKAHLRPTILGQGKLKGEIQDQYLSHQKAKAMLGWQPKYSLEDGLRECLAWYDGFFRGQKA
jgi:nucleoside-diphosphate-sugar epimerase